MLDNTTTFAYGNKIPWIVAFSLQFLISVIGNSLVLWIIYKDNRLKTTTNYLVANMAVSDLVVATVGLPNQIVNTVFDNQWLITGDIGNGLCKVVSFLVDLCFNASLISCVFIAIDRYYSVAKPFKKPLQSKMKYIIAVNWISAVTLCTPYLYFVRVIKQGNRSSCSVSPNSSYFKPYRYLVLVLTSGMASLFVIITYILTIYQLYHHKAPGLPNSAIKRREQQNRKVLKMAVTIVSVLYLCHGSWSIFVTLFLETKSSVDVSSSIFLTLCFILYISIASNFFIYLIFNDIYRENVKTMVYICFRKLNLIDLIDSKRRLNQDPSPAVVELIEIKN